MSFAVCVLDLAYELSHPPEILLMLQYVTSP